MQKSKTLTHNNLSNNDISKRLEVSPLIICGTLNRMLESGVIIDASISSTELGIIQTANGPKKPSWFIDLEQNKSKTLVINNIDKIDEYEQQKFVEILKYKTISSVSLPQKTKIVVLCNNLNKVSSTILSLCQTII